MPYGTVNADVIQTSTSGGILGAGNASIMKNRIINGAMVIDQRNAGASVTANDATFVIDRWSMYAFVNGKGTLQQNQGSVTPPAGFVNYIGFTSNSAYTPGTNEAFAIQQRIEGYNIADLGFGTANAKTITLSFWVRSSLTGSFGGAIGPSPQNRAYPFSYTISSANTWTQVSVTIPGDTGGSWQTGNGVGMYVFFSLGAGSGYSGTVNTWDSSKTGIIQPTGSTAVVGTNGATFYITGVQLEVGSSATGFEYVNYQTSLANCQRYYQQFGNQTSGSGIFGSGYIDGTTQGRVYTALKVTMRSAPTVSVSSASHFSNQNNSVTAAGTSFSTYKQTADSIAYILTSSGGGMYAGQGCLIIDNSTTSAAVYCTSEL